MVRRERSEHEFSVPDKHGNQTAAPLPTCGNSLVVIYFLFDTASFRCISLRRISLRYFLDRHFKSSHTQDSCVFQAAQASQSV
jgi:hypothetical protein